MIHTNEKKQYTSLSKPLTILQFSHYFPYFQYNYNMLAGMVEKSKKEMKTINLGKARKW
jgi:hypothetical protein